MSSFSKTQSYYVVKGLRGSENGMRGLGRVGLFIILLALLLASSITYPIYAQNAEASLIVRVLDPLGTPLDGIEVHLVKGAEVRKFVTNSTGYAEFRHLTAGEYLVQAKLDNITLAERRVRIPDVDRMDLTALISVIKLRILNLDGKPVAGVKLLLRSEGGYEKTAESNKHGLIRLERIPYSELKGVGSYSLELKLKETTIYKDRIRVAEPIISRNISVPLLSLKLTLVDLEGEPVPRITFKLSSKTYTTERKSENGTAFFENIPSSELEDVGYYTVNISMRTEAGDMLIYSEKRSFTESQSLSLIADLARIIVKVVDEEGTPIKNVKVSLSNSLLANFTSGETDKDGRIEFRRVPLSRDRVNAGTYIIQAFRAGRVIGEKEQEILEVGETILLKVKRGSVKLRFLDYHGKPLIGYRISLTDILTRETVNSTTNELGEASFKIFYGPYELRVYRADGQLIYSRFIDLRQKSVELKLDEVNFPLRILVTDSFGNPITSGLIRVRLGEETLVEERLSGKELILEMPYPAELTLEVYSDSGDLIQRERIYVNGPGSKTIRLGDYLQFGGLLQLEVLGFGIASLLALLTIACSAVLLLRRVRRKG